MLSRRRQLAAKVEVDEGVAETLTADYAKALPINPKISIDPELLERDVVRDSLSPIGKLIGKQPGSLAFRLEMRGSGTATTEAEWFKYLQACGVEINVLKTLSIGAITGGPFVHGETITGTNSAATGRVVIRTLTGTTTLYFVSINANVFENGEVITGGTSGATATVAGTAPITVGKELKLISTSIPSLTGAVYEDGICKKLRGMRGKVKFTFKSGDPVYMDFDFPGVVDSIIDASLLSGIVYETTKPPSLLSAAFLVDTYAAKIGEMEIDVANILAPRDDVSGAKGILSYTFTGRRISGTYNPEMVTVATHDFYGKLLAGTEMILDITVGSVAGNKFRFYAPKAQYTKVDDENKEGLAIARSAFDLNGSLTPGNDELVILAL